MAGADMAENAQDQAGRSLGEQVGAIWEDWDKFKKASSTLAMNATNFANWSAMGDASTLKAASGAIGKSCGGCHKPFRGPKPKKMKK